MKRPMIVLVIVIIVAVGAAAYWYSTAAPQNPAPMENAQSPNPNTASASQGTPAVSEETTTAPTATTATTTAATAAPAATIITYTDNGFSPSTITIALGTTVTFENTASDAFWPASNVHPVHSAYDGTTLQEHCANPTSSTFDACGGIPPGGSWSFTFNKTGSWQYHNHLNPSEGGTITVQ